MEDFCYLCRIYKEVGLRPASFFAILDYKRYFEVADLRKGRASGTSDEYIAGGGTSRC